MGLEHPPLAGAGRCQPGKPVPWGRLCKEHDGRLAAAQTTDWLLVHTQGLGPLLSPQGNPDGLISARGSGSSKTSVQCTRRQGVEVFHMILSSPGVCMTADPLCKMLNCQGGHGMAWHGMAWLQETRHPSWTSKATPNVNSS